MFFLKRKIDCENEDNDKDRDGAARRGMPEDVLRVAEAL